MRTSRRIAAALITLGAGAWWAVHASGGAGDADVLGAAVSRGADGRVGAVAETAREWTQGARSVVAVDRMIASVHRQWGEAMADLDSLDSGRGQEGDRETFGTFGLLLLSLSRSPEDGLASALGQDRLAPRPLVLWRVDPLSGRAAPVARGQSRRDGSFAFDRLLVPFSAAHLVVAPAGEAPGAPGASRPFALEPAIPGPPLVHVDDSRDGVWRIRAHTQAGATLLVASSEGAAPLRFRDAAPQGILPEARVLRAEVAAPAAGVLVVSQELRDRRRTAWSLAAPAASPASPPSPGNGVGRGQRNHAEKGECE